MKKKWLLINTIACVTLVAACGTGGKTPMVEPIIEKISEDTEAVNGGINEENTTNSADNGTETGKIDDKNELNEDLTNTDTKADDTETEDIQKDTVSIIMVGDMLLHDRIEAVAKNEDGSYEYDAIFAHTKDLIAEADIAIANEEVIIGGSELGVSGYPAFNAPFEFADELAEVGFDVICHGTNHALDKGGRGIINCLSNWEEKYPEMAILGIHDSEEDQQEVYICEKNGIRIAILNYTYGTNGINLPADMPFGVDYLSESKVKKDLEFSEENADFTIVCPHWGTEYSLKTDSYQAKWADIFADGGADLIIGTHPHVIEKVDWISHSKNETETENINEDKDKGEDEEGALCYYSLGNFVNWTSGTGTGVSNRMVGAMARVTLKREANGKVIIEKYDALPLVSHVTSNKNGVTVYPLAEYTDEIAARNEIVYQASDFSLEYCRTLVDKVMGDVAVQ